VYRSVVVKEMTPSEGSRVSLKNESVAELGNGKQFDEDIPRSKHSLHAEPMTPQSQSQPLQPLDPNPNRVITERHNLPLIKLHSRPTVQPLIHGSSFFAGSGQALGGAAHGPHLASGIATGKPFGPSHF
jgi:hypothetical protein